MCLGKSNEGLGRVECGKVLTIDQVFAVRQVYEKYLANGKNIFWAFLDLEKAYDTIYGMVCGRC